MYPRNSLNEILDVDVNY